MVCSVLSPEGCRVWDILNPKNVTKIRHNILHVRCVCVLANFLHVVDHHTVRTKLRVRPPFSRVVAISRATASAWTSKLGHPFILAISVCSQANTWHALGSRIVTCSVGCHFPWGMKGFLGNITFREGGVYFWDMGL